MLFVSFSFTLGGQCERIYNGIWAKGHSEETVSQTIYFMKSRKVNCKKNDKKFPAIWHNINRAISLPGYEVRK